MKKLFSVLFVFAFILNAEINAQSDSCEYNLIGISLTTQIWAAEMSWELSDINGTVVASGGNYADNSTYSSQFCLEDGCYTLNLYDTFGDGWNGGTIAISYAGITLASPVFLSGSSESVTFGINALDCYLLIEGCTDPFALNYDPIASIDDGSCEYDNDSTDVYGCTDYLAINFNPFATIDDGSCEYDGICVEGWINGSPDGTVVSISNGFNGITTTTFNGSFWATFPGTGTNTFVFIEYVDCNGLLQTAIADLAITCFVVEADWCSSIYGCTDPTALNYNANATIDDGSCEYEPDSCFANILTFLFTTGSFANEVEWNLIDGAGNVIHESEDYSGASGTTYIEALCLEDGCYTVEALDSFGDGWNGGVLTVFEGTIPIIEYSLDQGAYGTFSFGLNEPDCQPDILGCTDPLALNYNPFATVDDGSCNYPFSCDSGLVQAQLYVCTFANGEEVGISITDGDGGVVFSQNGFPTNNIEYIDLCLDPNECYTVNMWNNTGPFGWYNGYYWINAGGIQVSTDALNNVLEEDDTIFSLDGSCFEEVLGCTDPYALNYNPLANVDDGSCEYLCDSTQVQAQLYVCTFANGGEVGISITDSNGNVIFTQDGFPTNNIEYIDLCLDPDECYTVNMWNNTGPFGWYGGYYWINTGGSQVSTDALDYGLEADDTLFSLDGSCFEEVLGCTDPYALNYNPLANVDDGSCEYLCDSTLVAAQLYVCTFANGWEVGISIEDSNGDIIYTQDGFPTNNIEFIDMCLDPDECYTVNMWNNAGPFGWYGGYFWVNNNFGGQLATGELWSGFDSATLTFSINGLCGDVYGCTDYYALNYNPDATIDDGSCIYDNDSTDVFGCTDPFALNYDSFATIDNGSCVYDSLGGCEAYFEIYYVDESQDVVYIENLSYGPFLSYYWDFGDGTTSNEEFPIHEYNADGTYTVCLTVWSQITGGLCQDTYCLDVEYNGSGFINTEGFWINVVPPGTNVGIEDVDFINDITIYPNPSTDQFTLEFIGNFSGDVSFEILDISGRLILKEDQNIIAGNNSKVFNIQSIESGAYLMRINSNNSTRTAKFNVIK